MTTTDASMETLDQAIANEREDLQVLRKNGLQREAEIIERVLARVARAAEPFIDWLSETNAALRSDRSLEWLRKQFPALEAQGLARWNPAKPTERQYLRCAVPQRANTSAAREAGARGERMGR
jgi:hypothetical protein